VASLASLLPQSPSSSRIGRLFFHPRPSSRYDRRHSNSRERCPQP
jgi:hypothetical protein